MTDAVRRPPPSADAGGGEHASDEALLAALDGELDAPARAALAAHLAGCGGCRGRDQALRADAALVAAAFARDSVDDAAIPFGWADVRRRAEAAREPARTVVARDPARSASEVPRGTGDTPPARRPVRRLVRGSGWSAAPWRAAAGVALVAGAAAAAPAVLRWARERRAADARDVRAPERRPGAASDTGARAARAATVVRFPLRGDTLRVAFDAAQPVGELQIAVGGAGQADVTVDVRGGPGAARVLVLPEGVRVRNAPSATAQYRVTLPPSVVAVRVSVGSRHLAPITGARLAAAPTGVRVPISGSQ